MSEESSLSTLHLSVAMTTTSFDDFRTTEGDRPSPLSRKDVVYFQSAVVLIGVVGTAANALILYAMIASKQHKKQLLIFNQNAFDLCSCVLLSTAYIVNLCNIRLTGWSGYWLCKILLSEDLLYGSINGSVINLMSVTIERYLKVVHPALGKKLLRKWVKYSAVAFAWISSIAYGIAVVFSTRAVIDGGCYVRLIWKSQVAAVVYGIWYFVSFLVIALFIFIFCYWRILVVVRRQASVMAGHSVPGPSTTQTQSHQTQSNLDQAPLRPSHIRLSPTSIKYHHIQSIIFSPT